MGTLKHGLVVKTGATSLELDVTYSFSGDGNDVELASVCLGERRLPKALGERLIEWLGGKAQNQLVDEAWANAEEETDDAACDEARSA